MELLGINEFTYIFVSLFTQKGHERMGMLVNTFIGLGAWVALFILQGVALYAMLKRAGLKKRALAFVPFANFYCIGKLAVHCGFFGHRMKGAWIYALVFQVLSSIYAALYLSAEFYLYFKHGLPTMVIDAGDPMSAILAQPEWLHLSGFSKIVANFYTGSSGVWNGIASVMLIINLITQILLTILLSGLYKRYNPRNFRTFTVVTFLFPWTRFIFVFAMRKNVPMDYEDYVRRQQEAYARRHVYYGNPYNNPNSGPYYNPTPEPKTEDPFGEFDEGEPFEELNEENTKNDKTDDFFD